jgi:hypothetical protein
MKNLLFAAVVATVCFFSVPERSLAAGPTVVDQDITAPTTWTKEGSPYIVLKSTYIYAPLTIEPGTIVNSRIMASRLS